MQKQWLLQALTYALLILGIALLAELLTTPIVASKANASTQNKAWILPLTNYELVARIPNKRTRAILYDLVPCESGWRDEALNPKDLDGTPSYSTLQFKPSTLLYFGHRYGTIPDDLEDHEIYNLINDPAIQITTADKMIEEYGHSEKFWRQQWPDCSKKHGYWKGY